MPQSVIAPREQGIHVSLSELVALRGDAIRLLGMMPRRAADRLAGDYRALFRGRGLEFDEVRPYQSGDDFRALDWRVTARTGQLHTKLFKEEREHSLFVIIDAGASMHFGTRVQYKWVAAARVAALFIWMAVERGDRVGALVFGDGRNCHTRQSVAGQIGAMRLFKLLEGVSHETPRLRAGDDTGCGLGDALARLRRLARPGSSVLLLSDFAFPLAPAEPHLAQLAGHNDLMAVRIYDPLERELPPPGRYSVSDGDRLLTLDTADAPLFAAYREQFQSRNDVLTELGRRRGMRFLSFGTHQPLLEGLRDGLFPSGARRRARR
jgi:uncharacterized protein (DUF58 family)